MTTKLPSNSFCDNQCQDILLQVVQPLNARERSVKDVMYGVQCNILWKDGAGHMNARTTLWNGRTNKMEVEQLTFQQRKVI